jgi:c-di-GMP-binding flagellar brake protein YcgR
MPRRPLAIIVISVCYFTAPVAILVIKSLASGHPFTGPGGLFSELHLGELLILSLYPLSAIALLSVRKWGWYLFLGCSAALIAYTTGSYAVSPRYNLFVIVFADIALMVVAGVAFHKHVIAPYFNPRLRWWETEPRYKVEAYAQVKVGEAVVSGEILDISRNGCFATFILDLAIGQTYSMRLKCLRHTIDVEGRIMRKSQKSEPHEGYGVMFSKMNADQRAKLDGIITELERGGLRDFIRDQEMIPSGIAKKDLYEGVNMTAPRYTIRSKVVLSAGNQTYLCRMVDISKTGCFVVSAHELKDSAVYRVMIDCLKTRLSVDGRIERKVAHDGETGYGVRFVHMTRQKKKDLQRLLILLKRIGAEDRIEYARPAQDEEIEASVQDTPYKAVLLLKKATRRRRKNEKDPLKV